MLLIVFSAILFYRLATMERRSGLIWCAASLAASTLATWVLGIHIIVAQLLLFCLMWFLNYRKPDRKMDF